MSLSAENDTASEDLVTDPGSRVDSIIFLLEGIVRDMTEGILFPSSV